MDYATVKTEINRTSREIRHISYTERKTFNDQVNDLLDKINALKIFLRDKTNIILSINSDLEHLTWYSNLDDECLELISGIIAMVKDLHSILIRYYVKFDDLRKKGIAKDELKSFKAAIDDLKEINNDVESVFFELPFDKEFQDINHKLALL